MEIIYEQLEGFEFANNEYLYNHNIPFNCFIELSKYIEDHVNRIFSASKYSFTLRSRIALEVDLVINRNSNNMTRSFVESCVSKIYARIEECENKYHQDLYPVYQKILDKEKCNKNHLASRVLSIYRRDCFIDESIASYHSNTYNKESILKEGVIKLNIIKLNCV